MSMRCVSVGGNISCQLPKNKSLLYLQQKTSFLLLKWNRNILQRFSLPLFERHKQELFKDDTETL